MQSKHSQVCSRCARRDAQHRLHSLTLHVVLQPSCFSAEFDKRTESTYHLYYYKDQGCVFVCVSCLCRPPSHWWISFIFYTIIGLDPEGGQWLFKFKSNNNNKFNRQNAKQYMWDCSINLGRKHTNSDTVVGFENEMDNPILSALLRLQNFT